MGAITLYAIKSALCLAILYLPFTLLLRRETFFTFNRCGLLLIIALSLIVPCLDIPLWDMSIQGLFEQQRQAVVEVGMPVVVFGNQTATTTHEVVGSQGFGWAHLLVYAYILGMVICLIHKGRQLYRLMRFIPSGCLWKDTIDGVNIYCHAGKTGAFSWMNNIVVGEEDCATHSPVMLHEMAHVQHHHSWDAMLVAIMEILQWFNPCIWMLDLSLREIHEYEADDAVLRRGITARNYQLLLIKNAVQGSRYAFANAFNHSLLKKRITMMMKKKSNKWARMRLLYIVPATMIVLGAFASHQFTNQTAAINKPKAEPTVRLQTKEAVTEMKVEETDVKTENTEPETTPIVNEEPVIVDTVMTETLNGEIVYDVVEVMPEYPGGIAEMMKYLSENIRYPKIAQENGVQGRYIIGFIVTNKGDVAEVKVLDKPKEKTLNEMVVVTYGEDSVKVAKRINEAKARDAMEEEALRVVKAMPAWKAGLVKGQPVNCKFALPITFRLQ